MTNWDARTLSDTSLAYAAFDSIAAYAVYAAQSDEQLSQPMKTKRKRPRPSDAISDAPR